MAAAVVLGAIAFVRLAPADPAVWHTSPGQQGGDDSGPWDEVVQLRGGGATLRLSDRHGTPRDLLQRLKDVALATPRTRVFAGSLEEGRITWESRSLVWGFPDYTTAEIRDDGLYLHARLRFGGDDAGVNAGRLRDWLSRL